MHSASEWRIDRNTTHLGEPTVYPTFAERWPRKVRGADAVKAMRTAVAMARGKAQIHTVIDDAADESAVAGGLSAQSALSTSWARRTHWEEERGRKRKEGTATKGDASSTVNKQRQIDCEATPPCAT